MWFKNRRAKHRQKSKKASTVVNDNDSDSGSDKLCSSLQVNNKSSHITTPASLVRPIEPATKVDSSEYKSQCSYETNHQAMQHNSTNQHSPSTMLGKSPGYSYYFPTYQSSHRTYQNSPESYLSTYSTAQPRTFYSHYTPTANEYQPCGVDLHNSQTVGSHWGSYGSSV